METQITTIIIDSLKSEISDLKDLLTFHFIATLLIIAFYNFILSHNIGKIWEELKRKKDLEKDEK